MNKEVKNKHIPVHALTGGGENVSPCGWHTNEVYRSVFDNIGVSIALISPGMEIIGINSKMSEAYPDIDVSLKPLCYKVFNNPPRDAVCSYCPTFLTLQDGKNHEALTETPLGDRTGNFHIISSPIKNQQGEVIAAIELVEDVTEHILAKRQLELSENMYRTLFENTGGISLLIEEDTTISLVNAQFEKQMHYSKQDVENRMSFLEMVAGPYRDEVIANHGNRRQPDSSAPRQYEIKIVDKTGELRDVLLAVDMIPGTKQSVISLLDITLLHRTQEALRGQKNELEEKANRLEEVNTALRVLLRQRAEDQSEIEASIVTNVRSLIIPCLENIKKKNKDDSLKNSIKILEANLNGIISPFVKKLTLQYTNLTPRETQIANLVKDGKSTKEIADMLNCSVRAVEFHRNNMRKIFGLNKSKANLRSYLLSLS